MSWRSGSGFWHIMWFAGVAVLVAGGLGLAAYSVGFRRVEEEDDQATIKPPTSA
ncbi:MAG: hypothetical protein HOY71_46845 [Nonomuraea sp.]|nr:hypothetical protein [Nonomuraea sp.]